MIDNKLILMDIVSLEDGFKYFWIANKGAMSAEQLRQVADLLDDMNKDYKAEIESYFAKTKGE